LVGFVLLGCLLGRKLSKVFPVYLGRLLFWIGVPISIVAFLRQADLSGPIWIAPAIAWSAILLGAGLAWIWMSLGVRRTGGQGGQGGQGERGVEEKLPFASRFLPLAFNLKSKIQNPKSSWSQPTKGSFLLAAMVGNTGYLGYPVTLAVVGTQYFGWALFYDLLGSTFGAYGLGVVLAARFGRGVHNSWQLTKAILINPALWSFGFGLLSRQIPLPKLAELSLQGLGWTVVSLSLVLIGMRLSQLSSWHYLPQASISLAIKMLLVPLILGSSLSLFGLSGSTQLVMVLQMAMPPAFATLVLAEEYNLDRDLSVTTLAVGAIALLITLPIWLWLFRF
jgi:predicted permease